MTVLRQPQGLRRLVRSIQWGFVLLLVFAAAQSASVAGRPLGRVLDELRGQGLVFIYSTQVVPPGLQVRGEPRAKGGLPLAREVLAAHGLALSEVAPNIYAVIASPIPPPAAPDREMHVPVTPATLEEVIVQTSRYALAGIPLASDTHLTQSQVENMPRLADETLRAVQRLPGVATNGFSSLGSIRGGVPNETAIVLDGLRLYEPFHLKNFASPVSLLDSRLIEGIEFYSGGFPAIYGDRMSAIIDAQSVEPAQSRYYEVGLNLFHASALTSHDFFDGRGHAMLSARRSNVGDLAHFSEQDFGEPHYSDGFGRVAYEVSDDTYAAFNLLVSGDTIKALKADGAQQATARYRNVYAWGTLEHDWSASASSRLIASFTDLSNERSGFVDEPLRAVRVSDERLFHVIGLSLENTFQGDSLEHRFGAEVRRLWGRYDYASELHAEPQFLFPGSPGRDSARTASPRPEGYESSGYWDVRSQLANRLTAQAGLRIDTQTYDGSADGAQLSPRVSLLYALGPTTHLRGSWGRFFQSQGINELQVEDGVNRFHPAQRADHAIVSFDHSFAAGVEMRLEAYRKQYRRVSPRFENLFDPLVLFPEAELDRVRIAPQSARAEGVELLVRIHPHGSWSGWLSYAWSRAFDRIEGRDVPRSWDQAHAVNVGLAWTRGPWTAVVTDSFHTGWPTTRATVSNANPPQLVLGQRNDSRFDDYNTLDFRVTRTFALPRGALEVFVEVSNAMQRENPCCVRYEVAPGPEGSAILAREEDNWLPLVPSAGVLWRY